MLTSIVDVVRNSRKLSLCALAVVCIGLGGCNNQKKKDALTISELTRENEDLRTEAQRAADEAAALRTRSTELENQLEAAKAAPPVDTTAAAPTRDRIITIAGDVLFAPGSATIKRTAHGELDSIASRLNGEFAANRIEIAGYTDSDPLKKTKAKWTDNENLSAQRALAVERYFASKGVNADRMHSAAYGPADPKGSKQNSRRVEIKIMAN